MTYQELLNRLTDLCLPAQKPALGEKAGNSSSYDRHSRYDADQDRYLDWGANADGDGYIRKKADGTIVVFEQDGPGVVWRIWSALPEKGHMRVFLDGQEEPEINVPFIDWFERSPDEIPPLNYSELSLRLSRGRNSFIPIPYQKSCRIELAPGWGAYYHFTYTRFPDGTEMPHYRERFTREGCIALAKTDALLYDRGETETAGQKIWVEYTVQPGENATLYCREGSGAIAELCVLPDTLSDEALSALELRLFWDQEKEPSVCCALGDFFGGSPAYARVRTLPITMERSRYSCRFLMPFENGMRLCVDNRGATAQMIRIEMTFAADPGDTKQLLRFRARTERGETADSLGQRFAPGGERWPDWPLLITEGGCGRFMGLHLNVHCTWPEPEAPAESWWYGKWDRKNIDWWWGEGDEKFFVDGENFPSTFGTGSEDYIGYAWAAEPPFARFESSYAAMNRMPLSGNGDTSVMRFHIADNIPFQNRFEAYIEKYKANEWGEGCACTYAATVYWYQESNCKE